MAMLFIPRMNIRDVRFYDRPGEHFQRIENRNRVEGISGRIYDDGIRFMSSLLNPSDQFTFMIGLQEFKLDTQNIGIGGAALLDGCQRRRAIDFGLPHT